VLVGDIGGTNVRLKVIKVYPHATQRNSTIKELTTFPSQDHQCFEDCLNLFFSDLSEENHPKVGVVGIAGPVNENKCHLTNIPHWPIQDGNSIKTQFKMNAFVFINDFTAAAFGVSTLTHKDVTILGASGEAR